MIAIVTKYLGPTNYRGGRIVATWQPTCDGPAQRRTFPYDHAERDMHQHAAEQVAASLGLGFDADWRGASLPDGRMVWGYGVRAFTTTADGQVIDSDNAE